jgi:RNA polymerase sigma-70 factor (ECF subfamily)
VELNRAITIAETEGPAAGLQIVDELGLDNFRYLHPTRADLLRRLGRADEARDAYQRATALTHDGAERRLLERRLAELAAPAHPSPEDDRLEPSVPRPGPPARAGRGG